jgi:hypothetical protein
MKMLVIELFNVNRGNKDFIRIVSQPFRNDNFYSGDDRFVASNGFTLYSRGCPEIKSNGLYVWGHARHSDEEILTVPNGAWLEKLTQAVREYNNYLEDTGGTKKDRVREINKKSVNESYLTAIFDIEERIR